MGENEIRTWGREERTLFTKEDETCIKVRILRFMGDYVAIVPVSRARCAMSDASDIAEVENSNKQARLYPRDDISHSQFLGG